MMKVDFVLYIVVAICAFQATFAISPLNVLRGQLQEVKHTIETYANYLEEINCTISYASEERLEKYKMYHVDISYNEVDSTLEELRNQTNQEKSKGKDQHLAEECYHQAEVKAKTLKLDARDEFEKHEDKILAVTKGYLISLKNAHAHGHILLKELNDILPACQNNPPIETCVGYKLHPFTSANNTVDAYIDECFAAMRGTYFQIDDQVESSNVAFSDIALGVYNKLGSLKASTAECLEKA